MFKKYTYIFLFIVLGVITSFLAHASLEIPVIYLLTTNFTAYGLGLSWQTWFTIHNIGAVILFLLGVGMGWRQGVHWWKYIYIDHKYPQQIWKQKQVSKSDAGFTLIEMLVVIVIIGIISSFILASLNSARKKVRDAKRKVEIAQIGRVLEGKCYLPDAGQGEYDLTDLINELITKDPQYANALTSKFRDPISGTDLQSFYKYLVNIDGSGCAAYANLEIENEPITLPNISAPTINAGIGVFQAPSAGWNGSTKYYQVSN